MNETVKMIFGLAGGLALFLFGMNSMSDNLQTKRQYSCEIRPNGTVNKTAIKNCTLPVAFRHIVPGLLPRRCDTYIFCTATMPCSDRNFYDAIFY